MNAVIGLARGDVFDRLAYHTASRTFTRIDHLRSRRHREAKRGFGNCRIRLRLLHEVHAQKRHLAVTASSVHGQGGERPSARMLARPELQDAVCLRRHSVRAALQNKLMHEPRRLIGHDSEPTVVLAACFRRGGPGVVLAFQCHLAPGPVLDLEWGIRVLRLTDQ